MLRGFVDIGALGESLIPKDTFISNHFSSLVLCNIGYSYPAILVYLNHIILGSHRNPGIENRFGI